MKESNMKHIYIGEQDKEKIINEYIKQNEIEKVYVFGDKLDFDLSIKNECIKYADTIRYKYFYRLLQEINKKSLIVFNECLKNSNRYNLNYNCLRRYVLQTNNVLIFNYYPIVREEKDFMILYDMIQNNPFLKEKYEYVTKFKGVTLGKFDFIVNKTEITVDDEYVTEYEKKKEEVIKQVRKDADIIPRRLLKYSESVNKKYINKFDSMKKIKKEMNVVVNQLKVDKYYYDQLMKFKEELENVSERIQGH